MKHIHIATVLLLIVCSTTINCQSQPIKKKNMMSNNVTITDMDTSTISVKDRLKKQIIDGVDMYNQEDGSSVENTYAFRELQDAKVLIPVVKKILLSNGFRFDTAKAQARFKEIFKPLNGAVYPIHCVCEPCEGRGNDYNFPDDPNKLFFSHEGCMTPFFLLPQIIDYGKQYPDLAMMENSMPEKKRKKMKDGTMGKVEIVKWKDSDTVRNRREQNIRDLVAINCYLFNNNKAYVPYLISKMPDFVENLVRTYGYTKEPAFNKFVLEQYKDYDKHVELGATIFTRDCAHHLRIRTDLLDFIECHTDSDNVELAVNLRQYCVDLTNGYIKNDFTLMEKRKLMAYASITFDLLCKKHEDKLLYLGPFGTTIMSYYLDHDLEGNKYYKENNYLALPRLKETLEYGYKFQK